MTYDIDGRVVGSYANLGRIVESFGLDQIVTAGEDDGVAVLSLTSDDPLARRATLSLSFLSPTACRLHVLIEPEAAVTSTNITFSMRDGEGFYGLGERFGSCNHRGRRLVTWTEDSCKSDRRQEDWTYWPVPFVVSSSGYGILAETGLATVFDIGRTREGSFTISTPSNELNLVIFADGSVKDVIRSFTAHVGRPPIPPLWALGVWKLTLGGSSAVMAEATRLRAERLRVSAVWLEDQTEDDTNSGWGSTMGYPSGEYPNIPALVSHLHGENFRVLGYVNPQFNAGRPRTIEGIERGFFLRDRHGAPYLIDAPDPFASGEGSTTARTRAGLLDVTNPEAVAWWQDMLRRLLVDVGYDGWMHDFGELTPADAVFFDGRRGQEVRNEYPLHYQRLAAEVVEAEKPDAVLFVRSGWTGSHIYPAVGWPGDQHCEWSSWRGIGSVIPAALSVGMCGLNTWGPDIGGLFGGEGTDHGQSSEELWIRWCQLGALTPVMRDHLGDKPRSYGPVVDLWTNETTIATWRDCAALHHSLVPYLYRHAAAAHHTGLSTMHHLVVDFPDDEEVRNIDDQYMLGDSLMVAPVLQPGARRRKLYLPQGMWYNFWDGVQFEGNCWTEVDAPLEQIPIFVRSGTMLPLWRNTTDTLAHVSLTDLLNDLEFRVYPSREGMATGALHDGSAVSFDASAGNTAVVRVRRGISGAVQRCRARLPREWTTEEPARVLWTSAEEETSFLPTVESGLLIALPTDDADLLLTGS
jgi:alpha-D-xyloside xylohydrolase